MSWASYLYQGLVWVASFVIRIKSSADDIQRTEQEMKVIQSDIKSTLAEEKAVSQEIKSTLAEDKQLRAKLLAEIQEYLRVARPTTTTTD